MKQIWRTAVVAAVMVSGLGPIVAQAASPATSAPVPYIAPYYQQSWNDYLAMKAKAKPAKLPDWSGIWTRQQSPAERGAWGAPADRVPGTPPLTSLLERLAPKYKAAYLEKNAKADKGIEFDRLSACLPTGMPRWLAEIFMREFIVTPDVTWLIHEQISEIRRIYTDGKQHSPKNEVGPLWMGESIGFWDGDTLVIHTTHMKAGEYSRRLPDFSFKVSTVERMRSIDANTIQTEVTIYDPVSLATPYKTTFTYKKVLGRPDLRVNFASCVEGNNAVMTPEGGTTFLLEGDPGYHDPVSFGIPDVAMDSLPED